MQNQKVENSYVKFETRNVKTEVLQYKMIIRNIVKGVNFNIDINHLNI